MTTDDSNSVKVPAEQSRLDSFGIVDPIPKRPPSVDDLDKKFHIEKTLDLTKEMFDFETTFPPGVTIQPIEQTTLDGRKVLAYSADHLILLWKIGFKLVPTFSNSVAFNTDGLCDKEEFAHFSQASKPIHLIYLDPDFWTIERLRKESWRFGGVRCMPGKTFVRDHLGNKIGNPRRLLILDIDSKNFYSRVQADLQNEWMKISYVTKSFDEYHYHVPWLEDWNEEDDFVSIDYRDCRNESRFEIMIGLQCCQLLGPHRDYLSSEFRYHNVGCQGLDRLEIMYKPGLYNQLVVKSNGIVDLEAIKKRRRLQLKNKDIFHSHTFPSGSREQVRDNPLICSVSLLDHQIFSISLWAEQYYEPGNHYCLMRPFLGALTHNNVDKESVQKIINKICEDKSDLTGVKRWNSLLDGAHERLLHGLAVEGLPSLRHSLQNNFGLEEEKALNQIDILVSLLRGSQGENKRKSSTNLTKNEYEERLVKETLTIQDIEFVLATMQKEAECDGESIRQLFHACCSAFTKTPIAHSVNSVKAGAGKNHLINTVAKYFPEEYVFFFNHMSDKALFHQPGKLVIPKFNIETGEEELIEAEPMLNEIDEKIKTLEAISSNKGKIREFEKEKENIKKQVEKLIILDNTINIFIDTPPESLLNAFMSLVS